MTYDVDSRCPVCGMGVVRHDYEAVFQRMSIAFYSDQCMVRFFTQGHLYGGYPGQPAANRRDMFSLDGAACLSRTKALM